MGLSGLQKTALGAAGLGLAFGLVALQSTLGSAADTTNPAASSGALTLSAATATAIPTTCLYQRAAVALQNLDTADVYVGSSSSVTATGSTGGIKVVPGQLINIDVSCNTTYAAHVYAYSTAGTAANAVRYMEVR